MSSRTCRSNVQMRYTPPSFDLFDHKVSSIPNPIPTRTRKSETKGVHNSTLCPRAAALLEVGDVEFNDPAGGAIPGPVVVTGPVAVPNDADEVAVAEPEPEPLELEELVLFAPT